MLFIVSSPEQEQPKSRRRAMARAQAAAICQQADRCSACTTSGLGGGPGAASVDLHQLAGAGIDTPRLALDLQESGSGA
jgi:hypothetical protein